MSVGAHLDHSIDVMEETRFRKKNDVLIKKLAKETGFKFHEMELIMLLYYKIQKNGPEKSRGVTKVQLRDVLHSAFDMTNVDLTNDVVMSMVRGPSQYVPMETFGRIIALFLKGTIKDKMKHCFEVYDVLMRGFLGKDILMRFLGASIIGGEEDADEAVKDFVEIIMKKFDKDRKAKITFDDYINEVKGEPLLLEFLGPCLPSRLAIHTVSNTMFPKVAKM